MRKLKNILFFSSILLFFAFNFQGSAPSNWYQQFLPNVNGRSISDIFFLDSLNGWAVTPYTTPNDSVFVLKTTNGGDNWFIAHKGNGQFVGMNKIKFLDQNTGFACGVRLFDGSTGINKTTNGGLNWFSINEPVTPSSYNDMYILNQDTIWLIMDEGLTGGVFRTTNGGVNWDRQLSLGSQNPTRIYFYNARIGFITNDGGFYIRKTTNSGVNWSVVVNSEGFRDMHFVDSLTGWRSNGYMKKTTDGGLSWINQSLPSAPPILTINMRKFAVINKDTLFGVGGDVYYGGANAYGIIYKTTNGGTTWGFQVPDTSFNMGTLFNVSFTDKHNGWAYNTTTGGVHTKVGGSDTTIIVNVSNQNQIISDFKLYQNYPNPFNPTTIINYQLTINSFVSLRVYDLQGKEVTTLVNQRQSSGYYSINFDANKYNLSSGIYFYTLQTDNFKETKKMIFTK